MKLSKAQELAEQAIYDYTSSSKWQQVKYMKWTTAEMQDVIAKYLVKNINYIPCCTDLPLSDREDYKQGWTDCLEVNNLDSKGNPDVSGSSFRKDNYTLSEVKEIARKFTIAATPSDHIQGIDERFEEIWKLNFGE